jgi:ABC-2 type transport system permease protein
MNKLWVIARKDIREALRSRSTYIYIVILLLLTLLYFNNYNAAVTALKDAGKSPAEIVDFSRVYLSGITYNMPLWFSVLMCTIFSAYAIIVDKSKRSLESLMAAPVSLKKIWLGKSLGVTLPSVVIALLAFIIAYVALNFVKIIPETGSFIIPDAASLVSAFILVPLLVYVVVALVIYLQLVIANPRTANFVFTGFFVLVFFSGSLLSGQGLNLNYSIIYAGLILICTGIAFMLSRSLTSERVLLSSRS